MRQFRRRLIGLLGRAPGLARGGFHLADVARYFLGAQRCLLDVAGDLASGRCLLLHRRGNGGTDRAHLGDDLGD